ncbi:MAG: EVE domain-containing protein [Deltaproteobacteria bacterium]|nr:EVE domain-containing protein [Deltaproteobacteria bacterium]
MAYWLMKSEPTTYSFADLKAAKNQTTSWEGVRNYQARTMLRDRVKNGDTVFFYHSSCDEPGVVGLARVVREGYPDHTAFDPGQRYYDPKSDPDKPRWFMVDVKYEREVPRLVSLAMMRDEPRLADFALLRRGNRLSVLPVSDQHAAVILELAGV